ncbi:MAG: SiaC family regulatory phosphoprotein [Ekhidna sp.]|uniref:SiaC family regulatory phosphoprotein n=1 Tax=Ekhidna sp. TaxID=2608089 RepID=UPI0032EE096A
MDYFRKATTTSPAVMMDSKTKSALISGTSICRDITVYASVVNEMKQNLLNFDYTDLNIKLGTFNTMAAKTLLDLLRTIKFSKGVKPSVHWYHDREDKEMREMANDYSQLLEMEIDISAN